MKFFATIIILICCFVHTAYSEEFYSLLTNNDSVLVTDFDNKVIFSKNSEKKLIPASIIKILTSLSAFHFLGEDFRFKTEFYLSQQNDLIIKGYGDPLLISEIIIEITKQLSLNAQLKQNNINNIILDNSYFSAEPVPGSIADSAEPYDAQTGALCVNFNTVNFKSDKNGKYHSAEAQTPLLPFVIKRIKGSKLKSGRIILTDREKDLYPGYLFKYFLNKNGILVEGKIKTESNKIESNKLIYTHHSEYRLSDLVSKLLEFSNNFIANQIFLATGAKKFGEPASLSKSIRATNIYTKQLNSNITNKIDYFIVEGSGLSRQNYISAKAMDKFLLLFEKNQNLMRKNKHEFYKTGTLTGISTRAGYLHIDENKTYRYVIMCNSPGIYSKSILDMIFRSLKN